METERLRISLDNPDKVYFAGQIIEGEICLNLIKKTKIRAIKLRLTGKGKCKWLELLRKSVAENVAHSIFYSSKEIYAQNEHSLAVFEPRGIELEPGEHKFQFSVPLSSNLPSSFQGAHGSIKYKLRISIQKPWTLTERHTIPFKLIKNMPLPEIFRQNPTPLEKQITKTISFFGSRTISMLAILPENYAVRGEPMRICVTVTNNSTVNVEKLRFTINQYACYFSDEPLRLQKIEILNILNKETGAVNKKSERTFAHELLIPLTAQPTDDQLSGCINIAYELRVEAVMRGFFKNLVLCLPFKLYSHFENNTRELTQISTSMEITSPPTYVEISENNRAAGGCAVGNPFEPPATNIPVYPTLDNASPSHSSVYSESSSIDSTTSDSSSTTLSPANGGISYHSSGSTSSQFNSPAARASLRSTNVPYMPYSSSPQMINSYPPPHLTTYAVPDSPPYLPLTMSGVPPYSLRQPPPAGAHELPPSYEELFGTAPAAPETPK